MALAHKQYELSENEKKLFHELDKGIDDMEEGRTIPHDLAMKQIRERISSHDI